MRSKVATRVKRWLRSVLALWENLLSSVTAGWERVRVESRDESVLWGTERDDTE